MPGRRTRRALQRQGATRRLPRLVAAPRCPRPRAGPCAAGPTCTNVVALSFPTTSGTSSGRATVCSRSSTCWRQLAVVGGSWWRLVAVGGSWRQLAAVGGSWWRLAAVTGLGRRLVAVGGGWTLNRAPGRRRVARRRTGIVAQPPGRGPRHYTRTASSARGRWRCVAFAPVRYACHTSSPSTPSKSSC